MSLKKIITDLVAKCIEENLRLGQNPLGNPAYSATQDMIKLTIEGYRKEDEINLDAIKLGFTFNKKNTLLTTVEVELIVKNLYTYVVLEDERPKYHEWINNDEYAGYFDIFFVTGYAPNGNIHVKQFPDDGIPGPQTEILNKLRSAQKTWPENKIKNK